MKRYLAALLLGLTLLAAAAFVWANAGQFSFQPSPQRAAARLSDQPGVNVALERYSPEQRAAALDAIVAAGFGWIRQRFDWDAIEPERGRFDWTEWDAIVASVAERGLPLVAVLDGSPGWARSSRDATNPLAPPAQRADFGNFAAALAQRYGDRLQLYQVWDEPNIAPHWGDQPVDAAGYAGLLREAAVQLRSADPDAVIIAAALAPNVEPGGLNQNDIDYLDQLYRAGAAPWFDLAAGQPYGFDLPPDDPPDRAQLNFRRAELLRAVMLAHGDRDAALLAAAYGWHATPPGDPEASPWQSVSLDDQARWAGDAADWARRNWDWLAGLAWAWWQPPQPPGDPHWGFALVDPAGEPRPALASLQTWSAASHPLGVGWWTPNDPAVAETGGWRLTQQAADPPHGAQIDDNALVFEFQGTGLALQLQRGPFWGYLWAAVDGGPANGLPSDGSGNSYLVLHDPLAGQELATVADGLADGWHRVELRASGGWEQWPLLALVVSNAARPGWPPAVGWGLGAAGLALCAVGVAGLARQRERTVGRAPDSGVFARVEGAPRAVRYALLAGLWLALIALGGWPQGAALALLFLCFVLWPETGLFSLALATPLFLRSVALLGRPVSPAELAVWLLAGALAVRCLTQRLLAGRWAAVAGALSSLDWAVAGLLATAALSLIAADHFGVAAREFRTVILSGVLAYAALRLAPASADGRLDPWPVVWGIGLGAAMVAGWGLVQAVSGVGVVDAEGVWRVRGPYGSPNNLALYVAHAIPLLLAVAAFGENRRRRLAAGALALVMAAGLLLTFSKGGLLLGLPAAVLFMGLAAGGRWRWVALGAAVVGLLALTPLFATQRFAGLFDLQGGTGFFRLQLWQGTWNMLADHPWQGVGLDNFLYAYRTRYVLPGGWQEINLSHPHNIVLDFWTRLGISGLVVGVWLFAAALRTGWRALRQLSGDRWAIVLGLLASLAATAAHGLIDNSVFLVDLMLLFMLSLALIARLSQEAEAAVGQPVRSSW